MTPEAAVYGFMSGFGIPAYAATSVPDDADFPYITYELAVDDFWGGDVSLPMSIWYRGDSESEPNAKAREVSKAVAGGKYLACDDGAVLLKKGSPFCQSMGDGSDDKVKRRYVNLTAQFITTD